MARSRWSSDWAEQDWELIKSALPGGWKQAARVYRAIRIEKGPLSDPELLLRFSLGHIASGNSLRQSAGHARGTNLVDVSDVALLERLRNCPDWFEWMVGSILEAPLRELPTAPFRLRLVDATCISKPASTGTDVRVHLAVNLPERSFCQVQVTGVEGGESLSRFAVDKGDLFVGDRGYGLGPGIKSVKDAQGHSLVRVSVTGLPMYGRRDGARVDVLAEARKLQPGESREMDVQIRDGEGGVIHGRFCIHALTEEEAEKAQRRAKRKTGRKQKRPKEKAIEGAKYVFIFTTLPKAMVNLEEVFAIYRLRWQIELAFKTMKTVLGARSLPHKMDEAARAWVLGKLLCALIVQRLAVRREAFPP